MCNTDVTQSHHS